MERRFVVQEVWSRDRRMMRERVRFFTGFDIVVGAQSEMMIRWLSDGIGWAGA